MLHVSDSDSVPSPRRARIVPVHEFQILNSKFQKRTIRESEIWNLELGIGNPSSVAVSAALGRASVRASRLPIRLGRSLALPKRWLLLALIVGPAARAVDP